MKEKKEPTANGKSSTPRNPEKRSGFQVATEPVEPQEKEQEEPKYDLGGAEETRQEGQKPEFEELGALPDSYGEDSIYLTAKDPHWLFAYWDINWSAHPEVRESGKAFLRLKSGDGSTVDEIEIAPHARNWFIPAKEGVSSFRAEIGCYAGDDWKCICESNAAELPSGAVDETTDEEWATVPMHLSFQRLLDTVQQAMEEGESLLSAISRLQNFDTPVERDIPARLSDQQRRVLAALIGEETLTAIEAGSGTINKALQRHLEEQAGSVSAGAFAGLGAESAFASLGGASGWSSEIGASWSAQPFGEAGRGFWMNVNAEVIFYGATDPDATVWVDGNEIELEPDGTFRYHFRFPDSRFQVPIVAEAPDKQERRSALLNFQRATTRQGDVGETPQPPHLQEPMGGQD